MTLSSAPQHDHESPAEPVLATPLFVRQLSPEMRALVEKHFWTDFSDIIPSMAWDSPASKQ